MQNTTLVTAFFDIRRGEWNTLGVNNAAYIRHFASWARMKNDLVVYTDSYTAKEVEKIRAGYNLLDKTTIIEIADFKQLDPELYQSINHAMSAPHAREFHVKPDNPESWNSSYNYVMLLKWWCVCDAIRRGLVADNAAWVDFGFNKSGDYYLKPEELAFCWNPELEEKIYMYALNDFDEIPVYEIIQRMDTYIQGCPIIGPKKLWPAFWKLIRESMIELNHCGLCDDDQILMLMAYRKQPDLFKIIKCPWNGGLAATGAGFLTVREMKKTGNALKEIRRKMDARYTYIRRINRYFKNQKQIFLKRNTAND